MRAIAILLPLLLGCCFYALGYYRGGLVPRHEVERLETQVANLKTENANLRLGAHLSSRTALAALRHLQEKLPDPEPPTPDAPGPRHSLRWDVYEEGK